MMKRVVCLFLSLLMLIPLLPAPAQAAVPQKRTGTFYYSSLEMQDYPATYFYSDGYFASSAYAYQDSLATMSMCLAMSAFNSYRTAEGESGYPEKSRNLRALLTECGFPAEHFATNEGYLVRPTEDTIGIGASYKTVTLNGETSTLLAVAIRGGNYEIEWASNFTLGTEGDHQGFAQARDQVLAFLKDYISQQNLTGRIKLWITGYSRGAVTANMTAAVLDRGYSLGENIQLAPEDLYAYCFECPQGTVADDRNDAIYGNIFNIVNPADFVTKVAPLQYGFGRYGVDRMLPTSRTYGSEYARLQDAMLMHYNALPSTKAYAVDDFQMKRLDIRKVFSDGLIVNDSDPRWDQSAYLDEFFRAFFDGLIGDRNNYVANYQEDMRTLSRILFRSEKQRKVFAEELVDHLSDQILRIAVCLVLNQEGELTDIVKDVVLDAMADAGMTGYSDQEVEDLSRVLVKLLLSLGREYPELTITLLSNMEGIIGAHYAELCLAWLQSFDPNYTSEGAVAFASGVEGIHRISGNNRYETALEVADTLKQLQIAERFDSVIVASGTQFPDALAGSYLAAAKNAPILLVNTRRMEEVAAYIRDNLATGGTVYILGGDSAVPAGMEEMLSGLSVKRLAGKNRYETNMAILNEAGTDGQEILICTGKDFPDSLSASAVGKPILLVNKTLSDYQKELLANSSGKFVIIGGTGAVSEDIEREVEAFGTVVRLGGENRYETCVKVARHFFPDGAKSAVVAYSRNFPDGLCGGVLAYAVQSPLLLLQTDRGGQVMEYARETEIQSGIILGGPSLIDDTTVNNLFAQ